MDNKFSDVNKGRKTRRNLSYHEWITWLCKELAGMLDNWQFPTDPRFSNPVETVSKVLLRLLSNETLLYSVSF
jgi:hypothetical protein